MSAVRRAAVVAVTRIAIVVSVLLVGTVHGETSALPACQYEDGNSDGSSCTWFDPDTGDGYHVGSENYRDTDR